MNKIQNTNKTILLNGYFYKEIIQIYKQKIQNFIKNPEHYKIVIFHFNTKNNNYFAVNQKKVFTLIGLETHLINPSSEEEFQNLLLKFSQDEKVLGINMELPLPWGYNPKTLNKLSVTKDLDCLNPINYYNFLQSSKDKLNEVIIPSVAQAVLLMLQHYMIPFEKEDIVILGRNIYSGLAIAHLLLKFNSTVQILNEDTKNPQEKCKEADIIISCTGKVNLIDNTYVTEKSVVIDVGFEVVNQKIKGDVDIEKVKGIAKAVSIVPGGIGLLCNASTIINLYKLLKNKNEIKNKNES